MEIPLITLQGQNVILEPLSMGHLDSLCAFGLEEELWKWTPNRVATRVEMEDYINTALRGQRDGTMLPFAILGAPNLKPVGCTRFCAIDPMHRRVEIGWTWIGRRWQRSGVNTETKLLMLRHAFETLRCIRVELKTDALNDQSRQAILRIGATEEGILRKHIITESGRLRDTVYYSILDTEWPDVRERLTRKLLSAADHNQTVG
ncbi:MAG: GNAT family protein [Verrucomicrobia bacterium]|nr:GNAT family protein [Verrucomicrobiota bacterium]